MYKVSVPQQKEKRLPKVISKTELRNIFGDGYSQISWHTLHGHFLTDDFIENHLKITMEEYKKIRIFDFKLTKIIFDYFQITTNDL